MTFDSADFPWTFNDQEEQRLPGQAGANKGMGWEAQTAISLWTQIQRLLVLPKRPPLRGKLLFNTILTQSLKIGIVKWERDEHWLHMQLHTNINMTVVADKIEQFNIINKAQNCYVITCVNWCPQPSCESRLLLKCWWWGFVTLSSYDNVYFLKQYVQRSWRITVKTIQWSCQKVIQQPFSVCHRCFVTLSFF